MVKRKRKSDEPFRWGKLAIPRSLARYLITALCITAWLIFSANFDINIGFLKCGSTAQKIPKVGQTK